MTDNTIVNTKRTEGQTTQWPIQKEQNNRQTQWPIQKEQNDRQHNSQYKKNRRTDNTMANTKRTEGQTTQWPIQQ
jgi:hypothetical protein